MALKICARFRTLSAFRLLFGSSQDLGFPACFESLDHSLTHLPSSCSFFPVPIYFIAQGVAAISANKMQILLW
jgi:hypothetical protein